MNEKLSLGLGFYSAIRSRLILKKEEKKSVSGSELQNMFSQNERILSASVTCLILVL